MTLNLAPFGRRTLRVKAAQRTVRCNRLLARSFVWRRFLSCHYGVVQPVMGQSRVAIYARIAERRVLVAAEGEYGLIHLLGVEDLEPYEQMEVLHG